MCSEADTPEYALYGQLVSDFTHATGRYLRGSLEAQGRREHVNVTYIMYNLTLCSRCYRARTLYYVPRAAMVANHGSP